jgi:hypothetical protein
MTIKKRAYKNMGDGTAKNFGNHMILILKMGDYKKWGR